MLHSKRGDDNRKTFAVTPSHKYFLKSLRKKYELTTQENDENILDQEDFLIYISNEYFSMKLISFEKTLGNCNK